MAEIIYTKSFKTGYRLDVTENGISITDTKTDELVIDASTLGVEGYQWIVEACISPQNREFYIKYVPDGRETYIGISQRSKH